MLEITLKKALVARFGAHGIATFSEMPESPTYPYVMLGDFTSLPSKDTSGPSYEEISGLMIVFAVATDVYSGDELAMSVAKEAIDLLQGREEEIDLEEGGIMEVSVDQSGVEESDAREPGSGKVVWRALCSLEVLVSN